MINNIDIYKNSENPRIFCFYGKVEELKENIKADKIYIAKCITEIPHLMEIIENKEYTANIKRKTTTFNFENFMIRIHDVYCFEFSFFGYTQYLYPDVYDMMFARHMYFRISLNCDDDIIPEIQRYNHKVFKSFLTREDDMKYF